MNVVIYARYSSDRQNEQSIEGQLRTCMEYCKSSGYTVADTYIDRALSAAKDIEKRTSFQKMIKDSERKQWDAVLVYKLDRFARNRYDSATYKAKLRKNGVKLISATESISDNPEGIILESVLEGMAEFYSKELSQKVTRGMRESALKCNSTGGTTPLGYKIENKKLVIDDKYAPAVKIAFEMYSQGHTVKEICKKLNDSGYRTKKGKTFTNNSFSTIFKNPKYMGTYSYNDISIPDGVPAIISKEVFEKVQQRLKENQKAPAKSKATIEYLLTTKLFCGHCGNPMVGECTTKNGVLYNYYACSGKKRFHICNKKNVKKDWIENLVVDELLKKLTPENIELIADIAINEIKKEQSTNTLLNSLNTQLKEVEKSIDGLLKAIEYGAVSETLTERLNSLEKQKKDLINKINMEKNTYPNIEKIHIVYWLSSFLSMPSDGIELRRNIINLLVNSIFLYDEPDGSKKIVITFNLTNEPTATLTTSDLNFSNLECIGAPKS